MPSRLLSVTFGAHDPTAIARFWADLLGRQVILGGHGLLVPGGDGQLGLRFVASDVEKTGPNRMHLHLTSESPDHQQEIVATALRLGARHLDVGQTEDEGHIVLADPEANELCVIEPGNAFLAGCGFLGELACDGGRDVGVFWSTSLDWPLVWDQNEETAIQSPGGGTKVAWGGPGAPPAEPSRQHLELVLVEGDPAVEIDRLIALGATHVGAGADGVSLLTDPDGAEFRLVTTRSERG